MAGKKESAGFKLMVVLGAGVVIVGLAFARDHLRGGAASPASASAVASAAPSSSAAEATPPSSASAGATASASAAPAGDVRAELLAAVLEGNIAKLDALHRSGAPLAGLLSPAARSGNARTVAWLLENGVDVHEDEDAPSPPVALAEQNDEIVLLLLGRGAKEPSLLQAIRAQAPKTVTRVLSKKADPNGTTETGEPALHVAIVSTSGAARTSIVKSLLDAGAKADGSTSSDAGSTPQGETPLAAAIHQAELGSDGAVDVVKLLLTKTPVDRDAMSIALGMRSAAKDTVLDALLAGKVPPDVAYRGVGIASDPKLVARIAAKGVAWNTKDPYVEDPPLVSAARRHDLALVQALVAAGAPVDGADESGDTPLFAAVAAAPPDSDDATKVVTFLLGKGANVNRRTKDGRLPLFVAAGGGAEAIVKALLARGARVQDEVNGVTALEAAEEAGHDEIATLLLAKGAKKKAPPKQAEER